MKKVMLFMVLCFAVPAMATVTIDAVDQGGTVNITYAVSDANLVRALALDITVDGSLVITGVTAAIEGESTAAAPGYGIFPGSIEIDVNAASPTYGEVISYGSPLAPAGDPGAAGDVPGTAITVELGSVYVGDANSPGTSGLVCTLSYTGEGTLTITENAIRGGIVMEDVALDPTLVLATNVPVGGSVGCACFGDVSGPTGAPDGQVSINDLSALVGVLLGQSPYKDNAPYYNGPIPTGWDCMDISGPTGTPDGEVSINDLSKLVGVLLGQSPYKDNAPYYNGPCITLP
jgi:hypothetical protein